MYRIRCRRAAVQDPTGPASAFPETVQPAEIRTSPFWLRLLHSEVAEGAWKSDLLRFAEKCPQAAGRPVTAGLQKLLQQGSPSLETLCLQIRVFHLTKTKAVHQTAAFAGCPEFVFQGLVFALLRNSDTIPAPAQRNLKAYRIPVQCASSTTFGGHRSGFFAPAALNTAFRRVLLPAFERPASTSSGDAACGTCHM